MSNHLSVVCAVVKSHQLLLPELYSLVHLLQLGDLADQVGKEALEGLERTKRKYELIIGELLQRVHSTNKISSN